MQLAQQLLSVAEYPDVGYSMISRATIPCWGYAY